MNVDPAVEHSFYFLLVGYCFYVCSIRMYELRRPFEEPVQARLQQPRGEEAHGSTSWPVLGGGHTVRRSWKPRLEKQLVLRSVQESGD